MATKVLFEKRESKFGDKLIEQEMDCLEFHILDHEHKVQVWSIKTIKEAFAKVKK